MMRSGKTLPSQWLMFALFVVICGMCHETVIGNPFQPVASQSKRFEKLPREVLVIQQAVKKQIARKTNNPLLNRIQREHVGTDVLAYQLPTRMRPIVVHRSGGDLWRLSTWTADKVGQVPVVVVLGDAMTSFVVVSDPSAYLVVVVLVTLPSAPVTSVKVVEVGNPFPCSLMVAVIRLFNTEQKKN